MKTDKDYSRQNWRRKVRMGDQLARIQALGFTLAGHWELADNSIVCEFLDFAGTCNALYAFVIDRKLMYVGKTVAKSSLRSRLARYRNPASSQSTNIKNNRNIRDSLDKGIRVDVYVFPDSGLLYYGGFHLNLAAGLEDSLVRELDPPWNGGQKDRPDELAPMPAVEFTRPSAPTPSQNELADSAQSPSTGRNSKYEPLRVYLLAQLDENRVHLTFAEIERLVGEPLPPSAYTHREWWANQIDVSNRPQARAWTEAGFAVETVDQTVAHSYVDFVRC